jgi:isochorismate synthase
MNLISPLAPGQCRFDPQAFLRTLRSRLRAADADTVQGPSGSVVSITLDTPELAGAGVQVVTTDDYYWSRPAARHVRLGLGRVYALRARGTERLAFLDRALHVLKEQWTVLGDGPRLAGPAAFLGFAFDPEAPLKGPWYAQPNALLQIPELVFERHGEQCRVTFSRHIGPASDRNQWHASWLQCAERLVGRIDNTVPFPAQQRTGMTLQTLGPAAEPGLWAQRVREALEAIASGNAEKLVLTRQTRLKASLSFDFRRMLSWLEVHFPDCTHFAVPVCGRMLVGATPERLIDVEQGVATVDAIAGTVPTGTPLAHGADSNEQLFQSGKARREHALVVNAITTALEPLSSELVVPRHPQLMTLRNVHHLWSPVRARLRPDVTLLAAAARLHPTPAVGGTPQRSATEWLRHHGEQGRGWYTGALGWLTPEGEGELSVILRCGLFGEREAVLYSGAGIVDGSDPQQEFRETQWKLQAMLEASAHA